MEIIADILLAAGALGAAFYCMVLARRLKRFNDLEKGVGGAVAVLSAQVDDLNKSLNAARQMSEGSSQELKQLTGRAETVAQRLELMMASMHDLPGAAPATAETPAAKSAKGEDDALAAAYDAATQPAKDEPEEGKRQGVMFKRHSRSQNRVA